MLPESKGYFGPRVVDLGKPNNVGWAQGKCPFHEDPAAAFRVNVKSDQPLWHCFGGCGGGTMVDFHRRLYGLTFEEAVAELLQGVA
ncbi:CHC2 zinc finger domain-containing protein [Lysobacter panacisoli]|nr:CHC2 zinc finger domain-containing protein [Lysobacter panacisoli]